MENLTTSTATEGREFPAPAGTRAGTARTTEPVPVLYTIPNFDTAGSGRAMLNVIERLDRARFAPTICSLRRGGGLEKEIERLGIPYFQARFVVEARPLVTLLPRAARAARVFRNRFALWHSFHYLDDYTEPIVARFAGARGWIYTKKNMGWNRRSWAVRSLLASGIGAQNSEMIRRFFSSPLFRRRARLLPPGVDTTLYAPTTPARLRMREKLAVPPGAFVVGCVAHLVPVKGHPTLLEALVEAPGVRAWIVGRDTDRDYAEGLKARVRELGLGDRVAFLGPVEDVPALLMELDAFILPTWDAWRMEGCPVALLEAMAAGLPAVATAIPGAQDVIQPEVNGLLVPPRDASALGAALARLGADAGLRRTLGAGARQRVEAEYSAEKEALRYDSLYSDVLSASRPRRAAEA